MGEMELATLTAKGQVTVPKAVRVRAVTPLDLVVLVKRAWH